MSSVQRPSDRAPVGPYLGLALVLVLATSLAFATWKFLQGGNGTSTPLQEQQAGEQGAPPDDERLQTVAMREEALNEPPPTPAEAQAGSTPPSMTRTLDAIAKKSRGIDPDTPTHTVMGKVVDQESQEPVIHFEVFLVPTGSGDPLAAIESERSQKFRTTAGEFSLRYVTENTYDVVVRTITHADYVGIAAVTVPSDQELRVELSRGTWISGAIRDNYGKPLADKEVHLKPIQVDPGHRRPARNLTKTDRYGSFQFTRLPPGVYSMIAGPPSAPEAESGEFYLGLDQHIERVFEIDRQTTLRFQVTNEVGKPIPRARVTLVSKTNRAVSQGVFTNLQGEARMHFVRPDEYRLTIHCRGFQSVEEDSYFVRGGDFLVDVPRILQVAPSDDSRR